MYDKRPWDHSYVDLGAASDRDILFELHADCSLKANRKLEKSLRPSIFHFTWMEITSEEVAYELPQKWKRWKKADLRGSTQKNMKIGTVAASVSGV